MTKSAGSSSEKKSPHRINSVNSSTDTPKLHPNELESMLDLIPHMIFAKDECGRYTYANQEVSKLFGRFKSEIIGKTDLELNSDFKNSQRFMREDRELMKTGHSIFIPEEVQFHKESNSFRWYQTTKKAFKNKSGKVEQIFGVAVDLTERRRAENALHSILAGTASKTAEDFFRSLVYHIANALGTKFAFIAKISENRKTAETIAVWEDSNYSVNSSYILAGTPTESILNSDFTFYGNNVVDVFPEDTHLFTNNIKSYFGAPIFNSQGQPIGVLSAMSDQPMKEWEPAKYIMKIFAERAGAELTRLEREKENRKLQEQLLQSQKMDAIGQIASGMARDLNNALSAVTGHLELTKQELEAAKINSEPIDLALDGCMRAVNLVEQMLSFSKISKFETKTIDLSALVTRTLKFLERVIPANIHILHNFPKQPIYIAGDAVQLQQVITNLVINAYQAMPQGGSISVNYNVINIKDAKLFNSQANAGNFVNVVISDTGNGISQENRYKIFEPFFTTKSDKQALGLGLSMAYRTMQNHSGWIEVESEVNAGTNCILFFPICEHSLVSTNSEESNTEIKFDTTPLIMIIDDEPFLVEIGLKFLNKFGMQGVGFTDPKEAISWYSEHAKKVSLVIIDLKMPVIEGRECFLELKKINANIQAILLSGVTYDKTVQEVLDLGAVKYFQKPVKYPELMRWVGEFVGRQMVSQLD